jgi:hypothetical protein
MPACGTLTPLHRVALPRVSVASFSKAKLRFVHLHVSFQFHVFIAENRKRLRPSNLNSENESTDFSEGQNKQGHKQCLTISQYKYLGRQVSYLKKVTVN